MYQLQQTGQKLQIEKEEIDEKIKNTKSNKAEGVFDPKHMAIEAEK